MHRQVHDPIHSLTPLVVYSHRVPVAGGSDGYRKRGMFWNCFWHLFH